MSWSCNTAEMMSVFLPMIALMIIMILVLVSWTVARTNTSLSLHPGAINTYLTN